MKKIFVVALTVLLCFTLLAACTPDIGDLKNKYVKAGYNVHAMLSEQIVGFGADPKETEDEFYATKTSLTAYVIIFKNKSYAKKFESGMRENSRGTRVLRKGKAVIFGHEEAVAVVT